MGTEVGDSIGGIAAIEVEDEEAPLLDDVRDLGVPSPREVVEEGERLVEMRIAFEALIGRDDFGKIVPFFALLEEEVGIAITAERGREAGVHFVEGIFLILGDGFAFELGLHRDEGGEKAFVGTVGVVFLDVGIDDESLPLSPFPEAPVLDGHRPPEGFPEGEGGRDVGFAISEGDDDDGLVRELARFHDVTMTEIALAWKYDLPWETPQDLEAIREKYMPELTDMLREAGVRSS